MKWYHKNIQSTKRMKKGKRKETVGTRFEPNYRLSILNQKF
jgi:hypothetical protein